MATKKINEGYSELKDELSRPENISYYDASCGGQLPLVMGAPLAFAGLLLGLGIHPVIIAIIGIPLLTVISIAVIIILRRRSIYFEHHPDDGMTPENIKKVLTK
ncbi:hypothetical protein IJ098_03095 [Candidatus Saccharibacteria bacterium]|nr:hypothetical protein [Candidatus Saccharibacteria bacterium]